MPAPTLTPTGGWGKYLAGIAYLIASSATFRSIAEAEDAADALARFIHIDADDTPDTLALMPRAIVQLGTTTVRSRTALQEFRSTADAAITFQFKPSDLYRDAPFDAWIEYLNRVEAIIVEMETLQGTGTGYVSGETHPVVTSFELASNIVRQSVTGSVDGAEQHVDYFEAVFFVKSEP